MTFSRFLQTRIRPLLPPSLGGDRRFARLAFIETYRFPDAVQARFAAEHPDFDAEERADVFEGLRDYFAICAADPDGRAGMPSRIVDEAWHTFILFTREYADFCERAFGGFLHHAPSGPAGNDNDLRRTWAIACARENIPAVNSPRLPRLFGIDRRLKVKGGRYYALNQNDADYARRMMGMDIALIMAAGLGAFAQPWHDPIFDDMRASAAHHHAAGGFGSDGASFDSGADGGGGGGCSGGGN